MNIYIFLLFLAELKVKFKTQQQLVTIGANSLKRNSLHACSFAQSIHKNNFFPPLFLSTGSPFVRAESLSSIYPTVVIYIAYCNTLLVPTHYHR